MPPKAADGNHVKVAVRVRPFNSRELESNAKLVIEMDGATTTICDPAARGPPKSFTFDYSYWSFDGFTQDESGVLVPADADGKYADQRKLFDDLGADVVKNAFLGYNSAIFAYGQTGSGKSYSIVGYNNNKGIVPLTCEALFADITRGGEVGRQFQVTFSMLEIYNEKVRDLLVPQPGAPGGLKVRQSPKAGFFVEGLKHVAVSSYADIEHWMNKGTVLRTTASTKMNETSSRSHMVITLNFKQVLVNERKQSTTKTSDIHLVDLAGSERADSTGAVGDRLKEGSAINQSLSTLGNVISALVEVASGKAGVIVPYRDSVLTKLLSNAIGGNSRTIMIAAISPAAVNYDETLSTLRYADRAKQIRNHAVVNESQTDKVIRELREENARLQAMLARGGGGADMREQIAMNEAQLSELEKTWEQRLSEARAQWEAEMTFMGGDRKTETRFAENPHLVNINEDPQLSGVIRHPIDDGRTLVGRATSTSAEGAASPSAIDAKRLMLNGLSLQAEHAIFTRTGDAVSIQPLANAQVYVNGKRITAVTDLQHEDRIVLAPNHIYMYAAAPTRRFSSSRAIDYDYVQREIAAVQGLTGPAASASANEAPELTKLRDDIVMLLPLVSEANALSDELGKGVRFEIVVRSGTAHDLNDPSKEVVVRVTDSRSSYVWLWPTSKFTHRRYLMQELYQQLLDGADTAVDQAKDPFWDPPEDIFLGSVYLYLQGLQYCIDADETLSITNYQGGEEGLLHVSICFCTHQGQPLGEKCAMTDDPQTLLHKRMDFLVRIAYARGLRWLAEDPTRGVLCKYKFYTDTKMRTTKAVYHTANPSFSYAKQFTVKDVSQNFLDYLKTNALVIEVWGKQGDGTAAKPAPVINGVKAKSFARVVSASSVRDEAQMDALMLENDWRSERVELMEMIEALRQEVQLLQVEKSSLQKELSVTTLRTDSVLQPGLGAGLPDAVHGFVTHYGRCRARIDEAQASGGVARDAKKDFAEMDRLLAEQAGRVKREVDAMTSGVSVALNLLAKKK